MTALLHAVTDKCRGDGVCVAICPKDVLEIKDGLAATIPALAEHCIRCGQCVAVCPNEALSLDGLAAEDVLPKEKWGFGIKELEAFLLARRSVRTFSDVPVERALIDQVLAACSLAPPPVPPHHTEIVVLDRKEDIEQLKVALVEGYDLLLKFWRNPLKRKIIRWKRGVETFEGLRRHAIDIVRYDNQRFRELGVDRYLYGAPVVFLFHSHRFETAYQAASYICATYGMLAAHALGLGATMLDIVPPVLNNLNAALRRSYGIGDENRVVTTLIIGHPKYKYRRVLKRRLAGTRYLRP